LKKCHTSTISPAFTDPARRSSSTAVPTLLIADQGKASSATSSPRWSSPVGHGCQARRRSIEIEVAWTELARAHVPAAEKVGDGLDLRDSGREQDRIDVQRPSVDEPDLDQAEIHAAHAGRVEPGCAGASEIVGVQADAC
jgi:hypothetical protein